VAEPSRRRPTGNYLSTTQQHQRNLNLRDDNMEFWKRFSITLVAMLAASFIAGLMWRALFDYGLPDYISGAVGGLTALPLWDFLKRVKPKQ